MSLSQLVNQLNNAPEDVQFLEVIAVIDANYQFTPTRFVNGNTINEANQNNGSCKIFSFAYQHQLTAAQTLACFGDFYRKDVLAHPQNDDHQNIRNFIQFGWQGVHFDGQALTSKL
jgi:DNA-binding IscR family transcriptional regulator